MFHSINSLESKYATNHSSGNHTFGIATGRASSNFTSQLHDAHGRLVLRLLSASVSMYIYLCIGTSHAQIMSHILLPCDLTLIIDFGNLHGCFV